MAESETGRQSPATSASSAGDAPQARGASREQTEGGFDQIVERLRAVVDRLEAGSLSLEDSLAAFEEGVALTRRGAAILDAAERRVEVLTRGSDGSERVVPFAQTEGEGGAR